MNLFKALTRAGKALSVSIAQKAREIAERANPDRLTINPPADVQKVALVGAMRRHQRPLTGLEIRAVRPAKRSMLTGRSCRSKYVPDGIPARVTKFQKRQAALAQAQQVAA